MSITRIVILLMCISITYTLAHADPSETDRYSWHYPQILDDGHASIFEKPQKNIRAQWDSTSFQRSPFQGQSSRRPVTKGLENTLSIGGLSVGFHTELGTNAPFVGVFGYYRQPVTFTYTGQPQTVNLGWLGGVEYTDASWGDSYLGINTKVDAEIFLVTGMIGTDIQSPSGVLTVGAGFALHAMDLGVGVELFGIEVKGSGEYNGITPTALIAYTFYTVTGGTAEGAATFYARYQGQGFMVGVSLGIISFD